MSKYPSLKMEIDGYADGSWPKLLDEYDVQKITGVDKDAVLEYARAGVCPHVKIDGKVIRFIKTHILMWLKENVLHVCEGAQLQPVPILVKEACQWTVPKALAMVADRLIEVPRVSGVYFLVDGGEVVYVGQSVNVANRVLQHGNKKYDRVFVLPCSESKLNETEAAFIGFFKPKLNRSEQGERFYHNHGKAFTDPSVVMGDILANVPVSNPDTTPNS